MSLPLLHPLTTLYSSSGVEQHAFVTPQLNTTSVGEGLVGTQHPQPASTTTTISQTALSHTTLAGLQAHVCPPHPWLPSQA